MRPLQGRIEQASGFPWAAPPMAVRFKLRSSHAVSRYQWNFGDGENSTNETPMHTYTATGAYRVTVEVDGPDGVRHKRAALLHMPQLVLSRISGRQAEDKK